MASPRKVMAAQAVQVRAATTNQQQQQSSSSLLRIIGVALILVLAFHWYLVMHHVSYHAPHPHYNPKMKLMSSTRDKKKGGVSASSPLGGASSFVSVLGEEVSSFFEQHDKAGDKGDAYILSPVCGGCYRAYRKGDHMPCYDVIQKHIIDNHNAALHDAAANVGRTVEGCAVCDPTSCNSRYRGTSFTATNTKEYGTKYWRFDRTAPKFTNPTSLVLPSIPDDVRLPPSEFDNVEAFLGKLYADPNPENTTSVVLFEYNPGIATIPAYMKPYLPVRAAYVLSLRVTPHNFCFGHWLTEALHEDIKQTMHSLNHLGLALLDDKYQIMENYNVVIDLDRQLDAKRMSYKGEPTFVDFRLFNLNGHLYLHVNSDTVILTKLMLRDKEMGNDKMGGLLGDVTSDHSQFKKDTNFRLKNLYGGDQLEVTLMHQFNTIWGEGKSKIFGKNYALFSLPNSTHPDADEVVYAEQAVYPDHIVKQFLPDEHIAWPRDHNITWRQRRNFKIDHIIRRRAKELTLTTSSKDPLPSFFSADEHWFPGNKIPFKEFAHGGACCVSLGPDELDIDTGANYENLLVGVGHTLVKYTKKHKLPKEEQLLVPDTNYVSFFYAFEPRPPFNIVARSGYFCLGFESEGPDDEGGQRNPYSALTHNRPLSQNNETFSCPQIHYVSTLVEKVGDPSSVVIGYGINDCTGRLVEVAKSEISRLLFPDPFELVLEDAT